MSKQLRLVFVLLLIVATACTSMRKAEDPDCEGVGGEKHPLRFKLREVDGCVVQVLKKDGTDGEEIHARGCEIVMWQIETGAKKKSVAFESSSGSPFKWSNSNFKGRMIKGQVRKYADLGNYKYTVRTEGPGCPHDPMIIVER